MTVVQFPASCVMLMLLIMANASSAWHDKLGIVSSLAVAVVVGMAGAAVSTMVLPRFRSYPVLSSMNPCYRGTSPLPEEMTESEYGEEEAKNADISFIDWISLCIFGEAAFHQLAERKNKRKSEEIAFIQPSLKKSVDGILGAIGNTPLIRISSLSDATGCEILGKAEFLNPGGSVKDRVALRILQEVGR